MNEWPRVLALFHRCAGLPAEREANALAEAAETPEVVAEVRRLLKHHRQSGGFLEDAPEAVRHLHQPPAARYSPGDQLAGRYDIRRRLARGGMGEVYAAFDTAAQVPVALKVNHRPGEELARELRYGRRVTHRNVCRLFDLGQHAGQVFLTMEYLEGETLAARLKRGRLRLEEARPIAEQLLHGLAAIHQAGLVHGDFSPGNVLLLPERAVILDFGLAAPEGELPQERIGTLDYMAPERLAGAPATAAADIYSFGQVLRGMVDARLWAAAIRAAVEPVAAARLQSARELQGWLTGPPQLARRAGRCRPAARRVSYPNRAISLSCEPYSSGSISAWESPLAR
ncbi:MAG: serine/threonine protein kinase [Bryobacteraceae bacterium]|nr:serine/threonine protein kinase [Bryobacteraceae bacterium]